MSIQPDPLGEELKHYQSDLSGLASLIEALLNNTGAGIYIVQDKNFVYVNPFFEQLSGYTMQELAGIPSLNLVHPDDRDMIRKKVTKILKEKSKANTYEYRFIKKNGEVVWVLERITSMEYMGQRAAMGSFMDINQRKVLEDALAKSEERYRSVLEQMPDMYYEVDLKGNYTYVNDAFCKFGGRSSEELMNVNFRLLGDPALHDFIYEKFNEVFRTGQPNKGFSYRTVTKDGTVKHVETSVRLLKNEKGKATGFSCFSRDITERTRLEEELQRSEEKYRTMLEQMQDGYYEVDLKGNYTFANTAAGNILGVPKEQLIGTNYRVLTPPDEVGRVFQAY
ncbi:MAG: PAS domain S-box protein, partial [Dehalococcoidia bacterium]